MLVFFLKEGTGSEKQEPKVMMEGGRYLIDLIGFKLLASCWQKAVGKLSLESCQVNLRSIHANPASLYSLDSRLLNC
jgi:hypothetical protein